MCQPPQLKSTGFRALSEAGLLNHELGVIEDIQRVACPSNPDMIVSQTVNVTEYESTNTTVRWILSKHLRILYKSGRPTVGCSCYQLEEEP